MRQRQRAYYSADLELIYHKYYWNLLYSINILDSIERSYSTVVVLCTYGEHFPALCKGPEFEPRWDQLVLLCVALQLLARPPGLHALSSNPRGKCFISIPSFAIGSRCATWTPRQFCEHEFILGTLINWRFEFFKILLDLLCNINTQLTLELPSSPQCPGIYHPCSREHRFDTLHRGNTLFLVVKHKNPNRTFLVRDRLAL